MNTGKVSCDKQTDFHGTSSLISGRLSFFLIYMYKYLWDSSNEYIVLLSMNANIPGSIALMFPPHLQTAFDDA